MVEFRVTDISTLPEPAAAAAAATAFTGPVSTALGTRSSSGWHRRRFYRHIHSERGVVFSEHRK